MIGLHVLCLIIRGCVLSDDPWAMSPFPPSYSSLDGGEGEGKEDIDRGVSAATIP